MILKLFPASGAHIALRKLDAGKREMMNGFN
jgi:hypothetical protein